MELIFILENREGCLHSLKSESGREKKSVQNQLGEVPRIDQKATACKIRYYMQRAGVKPIDIQRYLNLTCVQTVYRWLDGTNIPTIDHLYALSCLFCVPIDDMIAGVCGESEWRQCEKTVRRIGSYWECCARQLPVTQKMFEKKKLLH